ncbi:MAG TPA: flagellar export chaperone FliS [Ruminococcaceae bacterium]|nr:flagellar export chaperone FliS [Oscillospiraceae bacterium]
MADNDLIMQYQAQAFNTMSRGELLVRLYDGAIKDLKYASMLLKQNDSGRAREFLNKSKNILNYLIVILNDKYSISANLKTIYMNCLGQVVLSSAYGDASYIDKIIPTLQELRDAWAEAEKKVQMQNKGKG